MIALPKDVKMIINRLSERGHEAFAVGGCVRDSLLGILPKDYDITTSARPDEIIAAFPELSYFDAGIKHGTVSLIVNGNVYEVTTYRVDGDYLDHRHPDNVVFVSSITDDLARRDLTINAMAYSDAQGLCDPFGGADDLKTGIVRAVGDPRKRFDEDALRILRALRFASVYGFSIDEDTSAAIHELSYLIKGVAFERVKAELDRLLCGKNVGHILREYHDVIERVIPEISVTVGYDQGTRYHEFDLWEHIVRTVENVPPNVTLRYTMLLHDLGKPSSRTIDRRGQCHYKGHASASVPIARQITARLKFDKKTADDIVCLVGAHMDAPPTDRPSARRMIKKYGVSRTEMLLHVMRADNLSKKSDGENDPRIPETAAARVLVESVVHDGDACTLSALAVGGNDLIALGASRGRAIGEMLETLLDMVIDGKLENRRDDLLDFAKKIVNNEKNCK